MLSYQAREYYEFLYEKFKGFEPYMKDILEFGDKYKDVTTDALKKIMNSGHTTSGNDVHYVVKGGGIRENFNSTIDNFNNKFEIVSILTAYGVLKQETINYMKENNINDETINTFFDCMDNFFILYQKFIQSKSGKNESVDFGQSVKEISMLYNTLQKTYKTVNINLSDNNKVEYDIKNFKRLEIQLLDVDFSIQQFAEKLILINCIYEEVSYIVNENTKQKENKEISPLKIIKIESGSELIDILGNPYVINIVSGLITAILIYKFEKYQKSKEMPTKEETRKIIREELSKQSINSEKSPEREEKIRKFAFDFSVGNVKCKINKQTISIKEDVKEQYLLDSVKSLDDGDKNKRK